MTGVDFPIKLSAFEKCSCCGSCYFLYFQFGPDFLAMGAVPMYFKAMAFALLESFRAAKTVSDQEYRFFGLQIAGSDLPEHIFKQEFDFLNKRHEKNPTVAAGLKQMFNLLHSIQKGAPMH